MAGKKPTHWIYDTPVGSIKPHKVYFTSYGEAHKYISQHTPGPKGTYHIYPMDKSGYAGKSNGRTAYHEW